MMISIRHYLTGVGLPAVPRRPLQPDPDLQQRSSSPPELSPESLAQIEPLGPTGSTAYGQLRSEISLDHCCRKLFSYQLAMLKNGKGPRK